MEVTERKKEYMYFTESMYQTVLKKSEQEYVLLWEECEVPLWVIARAYGKMMKNCDKQSFNYMAKIIHNWLGNIGKADEWSKIVN